MITIVGVLLSSPGFTQSQSSNHNNLAGLNFSTVSTQSVSSTDTSYINRLSIAPVLDIRAKSGWGISYSPAFVASAASAGLYMHTLSAGLERYGKGKMDLVLDYNHFFFARKTSIPYSPISNELFFFNSYTKCFLHPVLSASFGFGKDTTALVDNTATEIEIAAGMNHSFDWDKTGPFSSVEITPELVLNGGENQYFSFLSTSKYIGRSSHFLKQIKKSGKGKKGGNTFSQFSLSNLQLSTETLLEAGRFTLNPEAGIFIPLASTDHSLYGYWQLGLQYRF